jgi:ribosomal protein S18 acetylase RimI-like enzyme
MIPLTPISIVDYSPLYADAFRELNEQWITKYFHLEESDLFMLNNPVTAIIDKGGYIFVALDSLKPIGVCALIPHTHDSYELTKLAVDESKRGKGIGIRLVNAAIDKAREIKTTYVHLYSNTKLVTAIALYRKLGFIEIKGTESHYERCNIQMHLKIIS